MEKGLFMITVFFLFAFIAGEGEGDMEKVLEDPSRNHKFIYTDKYSFSIEPIVAGYTTDITVIGYAVEKKRAERITLWEDGRELFEVKGDFLSNRVSHKGEESHIYFAKLMFEREEVETEKVEVQFLGREMDFPPYISSFFTSTEKAGKWNVVSVTAKDIGDHRGIKRIILFEDGEPIEEVKDHIFLWRRIGHTSKGHHRYYAEVEDKGGQKVKSEEVEVRYSGEPFPPKIGWFIVRPEDRAGRSARAIVETKDKDNFPHDHGIERILLYEDGKPISEVKGQSWLLAEITHDEKGEHTYWAEVRNQDGEECRSKAQKLFFEGVDFPPEITTFRTRVEEGNKAVIIVEATDEKNIRRDAGIAKITLYEDGKPRATRDYYLLVEEVVHAEEGTHTYFAEVVNKSGRVTRTEEVSLRFKP